MAVKILIADDHEIVLEGIRTLIAKSRREWEICGEARDGKEAVDLAKRLQPDVAVLDITMPGMSGLEAATEIANSERSCRILIFTMHESDRLNFDVREAGAHGYVLKSQAARDLIRAIDSLIRGKTFFGRLPEEKNQPKTDPNPGTLLYQAFAFA